MSRPSDNNPHHFRHSFEKLPPEEQDEVLRLVGELLLWRGHIATGGLGKISGQIRVAEIAEIFRRNGMELPEYT